MRRTNFVKRFIVLVAMVLLAGAAVYAENNAAAEQAMLELVKKYDKEKGVKSITVTKGRGLEIVKLLLNDKMGKTFMKGVTSITIIEYGGASAEVCEELRKEVDIFSSILTEFNMSEVKKAPQGDYSRGFVNVVDADEGRVSDFLVAVETDEMKSIIYMKGNIVLQAP